MTYDEKLLREEVESWKRIAVQRGMERDRLAKILEEDHGRQVKNMDAVWYGAGKEFARRIRALEAERLVARVVADPPSSPPEVGPVIRRSWLARLRRKSLPENHFR